MTRHAPRALLFLALFSLARPAPAAHDEQEPVLLFAMLRNGDFRVAEEPDVVPGAIPWWLQRGEASRVVDLEGERWLVTRAGGVAYQPIPAYAPLAAGIVVRGRVRGAGRLALVDGTGRRVAFECDAGDGERSFEWAAGEAFTERDGATPMPRLTVELSTSGDGAAGFTALEVLVPLPCPDEAALRAEVIEVLHRVVDPWIERAIDDVGPRSTGLVCHAFDAITGERLETRPAGFHPLVGALLAAVAHHPDPRWNAALERYVDDFFALLLHPRTGLPRPWDPIADEPLDEHFHEIHVFLRFLLDLAECGPGELRARSLAAAERMAETVLARGVLPDGNVAALYRASDGASSEMTSPLRRLDMPAQLARLAATNGDSRLLDAARDAVATLLYTHHWPGTWDRIDPGFDDDFGHWGARAVVMARSFPEEALFRRVVYGGWERYRVLWPRAMRFGGSMAADQVRCWKLLVEYSELRQEMREELSELLVDAVHAHLRGQQYGNGAWGDVTYYGFQPVVDLQVGDLPGTPSNLLEGLAALYGTGLGPSDPESRAIFTAVLRSSLAAYGREHGFLVTIRELDGANVASGSLRIAPALTTMLAALSR
jgi:hypothetical protein